MSLRDDIFAGVDEIAPAREAVTIRGSELFVVEMSGAERDAYEAAQVDANKKGDGLANFRARLLVRVLVNADGKRVFSDADADTLGRLPARQLRAPFDIASKLNALSDEDKVELRKNS